MPKTSLPATHALVAGIVLTLLAVAPAQALTISASATLSMTSTSAPYHYTITVLNTGTENIGTFWFAWTDTPTFYDFLPSLPTAIGKPVGWFAPITNNGLGDGYGIEYYNLSG